MGCCGNSNKDHSIVNTLNPQDGIVLKIEGMTCGHCKSSVEKALLKVPGVKQAEVDLAQKQAVVIGAVDRSILVKAVDQAGYRIINLP
ncbi:heavy-metal-associated domain-containing protein [Desulfosporosinus sp.]|uniref:CopZ family metallochaperone n=1 Tax=Desulfosporosinus sp. TaxID=157907 RepID=UPI00345B8DB0|nr:heavy-metal-associated domain-containing protein [Desulfosporosinus sp.]